MALFYDTKIRGLLRIPTTTQSVGVAPSLKTVLAGGTADNWRDAVGRVVSGSAAGLQRDADHDPRRGPWL